MKPTLTILTALLLAPLAAMCAADSRAFAPPRDDAAQEKPPLPLALQDNFPKAVHYRYANNFKVRPGGEDAAYRAWLANYGGAMGVELDNRVTLAKDGTKEVIQRVIKEHPEQFFIYYTTGHIKVPDDQSKYFDHATGAITDYYPGHWAYQPRARVLQNAIPLENGPTTIKVEMIKPRLPARESTTDEDVAAKTSKKAFDLRRDRGDDVCLYTLKADGQPDWDNSEQVAVVGMDEKAGTITIKRGCYGSTPKTFQGQIYAAVHCEVVKFHGWYYNFSTFCPKDAQGRTVGDIWAAKYAALFQPGGSCENFDAIQQDTQVEEVWPDRGVDLNNNGKDDGFDNLGGVNWFSVGLTRTLKTLREQLPPRVNMMPDAGNRGFHYVNGWEVEGFPGRHDPSWRRYSEVCNRLNFSRQTCVQPRFTHVQHKIFNFTLGSDEKAEILKGKKMPANLSRAVFALATVYEAGVTWYSLPPEDPDGTSGVYDELRMGKERRVGWLGKTVGEPIYPATKTPNLADGILTRAGAVEGEGGTVLRREDGTLIASNPDAAKPSRLGIQLTSPMPDLTIFVTLRGLQRKGVEVKMPRYVHASLTGGDSYDGYLIPQSPVTIQRGMILKNGQVKMLGGPAEAKVEFVANLHTLRLWHKDPNMAKLFWQVRRRTPDDARLFFWVHNVNSPCSVEAAVIGQAGAPGDFKEIARVRQVQGPAPLQRNVDLVPLGLAGKDVVFRFLSETRKTGGVSNGAWGEVAIASPDAGGNVPAGPSRLSLEGFIGEETHPQVFHFLNTPVNTPLKLELEFEGGEEVVLESFAAHAAPGAIAREFENGLVLVNPSPRPYAFHLSRLFPNHHFHRLVATSTQDIETNNGKAVGPEVTLGQVNGLFLIKDKTPP